MNKMYLIIIVSMVALISISGCTNRTADINPNQGITISSFTASPTTARDGDFVLFTVEFENVGGTTARNVQVDFFGVEGQWRDAYGNLITDTRTQAYPNMNRPIPERNKPGDLRMAQLDLMTKDVPQGITPSLPVEARVTYDYNTSGNLIFYLISEDEWSRKNNLGEAMPMSVIINSAGPIKLDLGEKFRNPAVIYAQSGQAYDTVPLRIIFTNVGDGFPITPEDDGRIRGAGGKLTGRIDLFGPDGVEFDNCLGVTSGKVINLEDSAIPLKLRDDGTVPVACSIKIDKSRWSGPIETVQLDFNIFYRYYVHSTLNVQVIGE